MEDAGEPTAVHRPLLPSFILNSLRLEPDPGRISPIRLQRRAFSVFADHPQVYLLDAEVHPMAPEDWTEEDVLQCFEGAGE